MIQGYRTENIRKHNMKVIAGLLFKNELSCNEIAQRIGISETAVKKNINQLIENDWVVHSDKEEILRSRGGQHIRYKINGKYGSFVFINFSHDENWFVVTDFSFNKIYREKLVLSTVISREEVERASSRILQVIVVNEYPLPVRGVVVAVPGQIDNKTGDFIYSSRFDRSGIHNISKMFIEKFEAPVYVHNDTQFEVMGELEHGDFSNNTTIYYVNIGAGLSSVIVNNSKFVLGTHGIAGEIGNNITEDGDNLHMHCAFGSLIEKTLPYLEEPTAKGLIEAFSKNEYVKECVLNSAEVLAKQLDAITNVLGCDRVVIMGGVRAFGEIYLNRIKEYFNRYPKGFKREIVISEYTDNCFTGMKKLLCDSIISRISN